MSALADNITVHIERLVLDGLPISRAEGLTLQRALETELARLLDAHDVTEALRLGAAVAALPISKVDLTAAASPTQMGRAIANTIHAGLAQPASGTGRCARAKPESVSAATTQGAPT
ncbi:MAG: hypothetical protein M3N23_02015 [Pseudomonadota bacterium]|nr:hypothetical protein [Pseudomonadota bacterium]